MTTLAVVPVKRLGRALRRLSRVLAPADRHALQEAMLRDVLAACRAARRLDGVVVVTEDPEAAALAEREGAATVPDHVPPRGMNAAVQIGLETAEARGAGAALVLVSDLPLATGPAVDAVVDAAPPPPGGVLVPSRDGTGTNALLIAPPTALAPQLGPSSRARHLELAATRRVPVVELAVPRLALDVDTAADLADLARVPERSIAAELTRARGLADAGSPQVR